MRPNQDFHIEKKSPFSRPLPSGVPSLFNLANRSLTPLLPCILPEFPSEASRGNPCNQLWHRRRFSSPSPRIVLSFTLHRARHVSPTHAQTHGLAVAFPVNPDRHKTSTDTCTQHPSKTCRMQGTDGECCLPLRGSNGRAHSVACLNSASLLSKQ